ncbi:hypothetical protein AB0K89_02360 [Streptomyces cinnamoneus]|uniref:hypothetical protein n=1 Tax=Streptomyces cinnamoneus TaxID=53446 RepID=UPI003428ECB2
MTHARTRRRKARASLATGVLGAALTLGLSTVPLASASADSPAVPQSFADQGRAAGLTSKQITALQRETERESSVTGGRQVALNKISLKGGEITVPVPGEKYPLDLIATAATKTKVYEECKRGNFCGWPGRNGTGKIWQRGACGQYHEIPDGWNSGGSWKNNQSDGLVASFHRKNKAWLSDTPPAPTGIFNGDWGPVWYVRAC